MARKRLANVNNLRKLKAYKNYLRKKIYIRERLMNKHFSDFKDNLSAENISKEVLKGLKLEGTFWSFIPKLFSKDSFTKFIIPIFSGLSAAITSSFLYKEKKKKKENNDYPPYSEEDLFI